MSRPSWAVPSQWAADGGSSRDARSCASGSYGASSGAKSAPIAKRAMSASARTLSGSRRIGDPAATNARPPVAERERSATLDPRIEPVVGDVDDEVRERIDERREQGHTEDRGEVEAHGGSGRVATETRPAED